MRQFSTLLFLLVLGCNSAAVAPLAVFPVTGSLKVGGKPLPDITVQLIPFDENSKSKPGIGKTDKDGNFAILTNGDKGANAGKFKVVLSAGTPDALKGGGSSYEEEQKARYAQSEQISGDNAKSKGLQKTAAPFPKEWGTSKTSPKEVEIVDKAVIVNIDI